MNRAREDKMELVAKVKEVFKATNFSIVEVGVIATRLGIEDEEIHERHFKAMFDEIVEEIDTAIPMASKSKLQAALEYIEHRIKLRLNRGVM